MRSGIPPSIGVDPQPFVTRARHLSLRPMVLCDCLLWHPLQPVDHVSPLCAQVCVCVCFEWFTHPHNICYVLSLHDLILVNYTLAQNIYNIYFSLHDLILLNYHTCSRIVSTANHPFPTSSKPPPPPHPNHQSQLIGTTDWEKGFQQTSNETRRTVRKKEEKEM